MLRRRLSGTQAKGKAVYDIYSTVIQERPSIELNHLWNRCALYRGRCGVHSMAYFRHNHGPHASKAVGTSDIFQLYFQGSRALVLALYKPTQPIQPYRVTVAGLVRRDLRQGSLRYGRAAYGALAGSRILSPTTATTTT